MLRAILYQSHAGTEFPSNEDYAILEKAWSNNRCLGVTGYLLRSRLKYFQFLEGEAEALEDLLGRIRTDQRHDGLEVLLDETVSERRFTGWAMGFHLITEDERDAFAGWRQDGVPFARSMIAYMEEKALQREARSTMAPGRR